MPGASKAFPALDHLGWQFQLLNALAVVSLTVVVALAVNSRRSRVSQRPFRPSCLLAQFHMLLEDVDFASNSTGIWRQVFFPAQAVFHKNLPGSSFRQSKLVDTFCQK